MSLKKEPCQTQLKFGVGENGVEFVFYDYGMGEESPVEGAEPTYEIWLSFRELDEIIEKLKAARKKSLWRRMMDCLKDR